MHCGTALITVKISYDIMHCGTALITVKISNDIMHCGIALILKISLWYRALWYSTYCNSMHYSTAPHTVISYDSMCCCTAHNNVKSYDNTIILFYSGTLLLMFCGVITVTICHEFVINYFIHWAISLEHCAYWNSSAEWTVLRPVIRILDSYLVDSVCQSIKPSEHFKCVVNQ